MENNLVCRIQVMATSEAMILKLTELFDKLEVSHYVKSWYDRDPNHKPAYGVQIGRLSEAKRFLNIIIPHLVVKGAQAKLALRYVESRLRANARQGDPQGQRYTQEELALVQDLHVLNLRRNPQRPYVSHATA